MHDAGYTYGNDVNFERRFKPGMVLTVEPGIYIRPGSNVDPKWIGIGIRIEDDVLVTETGNTVLTAFAQKEIDEIERLMAQPKVVLHVFGQQQKGANANAAAANESEQRADDIFRSCP